jgi:hypothetical protein
MGQSRDCPSPAPPKELRAGREVGIGCLDAWGFPNERPITLMEAVRSKLFYIDDDYRCRGLMTEGDLE